ncbi:MAG: SPOR domain-containing protein [Bacteroidales bacterium]
MKIFFIGCIMLVAINASAQTSGNVTVHEPQQLSTLLEKHRAINQKMDGIPGFRIQIFSDSGTRSRDKAQKAKANFRMKFKELDAYIVFDSPNYKVEVGNFVKRLHAEQALKELKSEFPGAYIVSEDEIDFPDL